MAETYGDYFTGLGRSIGQGVTLGFGDEIEAGIRALGAGTYDEEVAKIRADLARFQETNPVSAFAGELAGAVPTAVAGGAGLASLGIRGAARVGAIEGAIYGAGTGESAEGRALGAALGAPTGAVAGKVGEKAMEGIAPMVGKFMKRGSGSEIRGATDIQLDAAEQPRATVFDVETGVTSPLEKTVGEPGSRVKYDETGTVELIKPASDLGPGGINPVTKDPVLGLNMPTADYSPIENALANAERVMNASPTKGLTGEQYLARLPKQPSVTKAEMKASGLATFLAKPENKNRKIPVAEVQQYMKEYAPDIQTFKYTADNNDVSYRDTQRFMDDGAYSEVGYGEITINNRNAHSASGGHVLSHYRDQSGNVAHVRYSDHNDASGGVSRVIEENQFDVLQSLTARERGERGLRKIAFVELTPEKVREFDAKIEKMRASPEYALQQQAGDEMTTTASKLYEAEGRRNGMLELIERFETDVARKKQDGVKEFRAAGKETVEGLIAGQPVSSVLVDSRISNAMPDFMQGVVTDTLRKTQGTEFNANQIKDIITRAVTMTPIQIRDEVLDQASKRTGEDLRAQYGPDPSNTVLYGLFESVAKMPDLVALKVSRELDDAIYDFHKNNQVFGTPFGAGVREIHTAQSARLRPVMSQSMSGRMLDSVSRDIDQDYRSYLSNIRQRDRFQKQRGELFSRQSDLRDDYEAKTFDMVVKNLDEKAGALSDNGRAFLEYASRVNFLPMTLVRQMAPGTPAQLVPNQPFDTPLQAARHNIFMAVDDAVNEGVERIYFPDYRDLAELRGVSPEGFFKTVYKDAPEKVIKELKQKFPNLKSGLISPDDFVGNHLSEIGDEAQVTQPVLYIDISSIDKLGIPRRYAKGGQVDLRSGIGNMFRLYS